jgi:periplasmic protein TonB
MDHTAMTDPETEPKPSMRIWALAALGALAIHAGGAALALAHLPTTDPETELGAEAIEVGLAITSPHLATTDAPAGPNVEASTASPAQAEQKSEVEEAELPKNVPNQTEDPDRVVAPKPKQDDPQVAQVQTSASRESVAQVAMATPSLADVPEGHSQAPVQGIGKNLQQLQASWNAHLDAHFKKHLRVPDLPKDKNVKVWVDVTFDRLGHVISCSIAESSGDPAYDKAALAMIHRSDPVPKPPPLVADAGLRFKLPVLFTASK